MGYICPNCKQEIYHWYKGDDGKEHWFCDDCKYDILIKKEIE